MNPYAKLAGLDQGVGCGCLPGLGASYAPTPTTISWAEYLDSSDPLLALEHELQRQLDEASHQVPDAELPQPPENWQSWATRPQTTVRALTRVGLHHGVWAVRNIRGGPEYQGGPLETLSNILDHSARFAFLWTQLRARGAILTDPDAAVAVFVAALSAAQTMFPAAIEQAHEEGRKRGYAEGYVAGWRAAYENGRGLVERALDDAKALAVIAADTVKTLAQQAADAAVRAAPAVGGGLIAIALALVLFSQRK